MSKKAIIDLTKLSSSQLHKLHIALWSWLAEHPEMEKEDWPKWQENGGNIYSHWDCFACEYRDKIEGDYCPLEWLKSCTHRCIKGTCYTLCTDSRALYYRWVRANGKRKSNLAKQIVNMEWTPYKPKKAIK